MRRIRQYHIAPEILIDFGSGKFEVVEDSLPRDAQIVGAGYDNQYDRFFVNVQSEEFEPIASGCAIPVHNGPTIQRLE